MLFGPLQQLIKYLLELTL